jgi:DNA-binding transcriptional LysR family regulator
MHDHRLNTFYTVARLKSFSKAAKKLCITQPAVSFQIRQLEEYYGAKLIDTRNNQFSLTKTGQLLFEYVERIHHLYQEMDHSLKKATGNLAENLLLGASTTPGEYILPNILVDYQKKYPGINVFLTIANTDRVVNMVEQEQVDFAVVGRHIEQRGLIASIFKEDDLVLIIAPSAKFENSQTVKLEIFDSFPLILREEGSATRKESLKTLQSTGLDINQISGVLTLGSSEAIKRAVEAGVGVSVISRWAVRREIQLGILKAFTINDVKFDRKFYFIYKTKSYKQKMIRQFIEYSISYDFTPLMLPFTST